MDEERPGRRLLIAGAVAYGAVTLVSLAFLTIRPARTMDVLWTLVFTPPLLGLFAVFMSPAALGYALMSGVPGVSIMYGFQTAKRYWRVVLGGLLLASTVVAASYSFINIR
jgi:hypothetical protein